MRIVIGLGATAIVLAMGLFLVFGRGREIQGPMAIVIPLLIAIGLLSP